MPEELSFSVSRREKSLELDSPKLKSEFQRLLFCGLGNMSLYFCLYKIEIIYWMQGYHKD